MDWIQILQEIVASGIGTVAFALMFHVPKSCYPLAGVAGGAGWLIYRLVQNGTDSSVQMCIRDSSRIERPSSVR